MYRSKFGKVAAECLQNPNAINIVSGNELCNGVIDEVDGIFRPSVQAGPFKMPCKCKKTLGQGSCDACNWDSVKGKWVCNNNGVAESWNSVAAPDTCFDPGSPSKNSKSSFGADANTNNTLFNVWLLLLILGVLSMLVLFILNKRR